MKIRCFTIFRIHKYSIHFLYYTINEFVILLYTFLVISLAPYWEYKIYLTSFSKFLDVLPAFTCVKSIGNVWSICLGVNIFRLEWSTTLSEKPICSIFIGNSLLSKGSRTLSLTSKSASKFLRTYIFYVFFSAGFCGYVFLLKIHNFN